MKAVKRILCLVLSVAMLFSLVACGGGNGSNNSGSNTDTNVGVRYNENNELLYKPEDVGELNNPVVTGLISPAPSDDWYAANVGWKEDVYDIEYDYDTCPWTEREMKWVAAFVSGTAYDIVTRIKFPATVVKGLLQPLDDILPVDDERYFEKAYEWKGKTYGVNVVNTSEGAVDVSSVYGVWYNQDLFEENGLTTPAELYENGEWDIEAFKNAAAALTLDTDRDGMIDVYGWSSYMKVLFTLGNGASTVEFTDDGGINLTWNTPAYIRGLENLLDCLPYASTATDTSNKFQNGKLAMYLERIQQAYLLSPESDERVVNFTADWVPFPKGQDGEGHYGYIGNAGCETSCIGAGAKNIEGAKVFICADICKFDYVKPEEASSTMKGCTDAMFERALSIKDKFLGDNYRGIGNLESKMYNVWDSLSKLGVKAAIEKYTPIFQKEIDTQLAETVVKEQEPFKSLGTVDFEDGNVVLAADRDIAISITDSPDEVISGSKSLKIKLDATKGSGLVAHTTADNYSLPLGGNYKVSFKVKAVGGTPLSNSLIVTLRPTADTTLTCGTATKVKLSEGEAVDVELMVSVLDFYDDLQVYFSGNTDDTAPDLALIIDDFTVEEIAAQ